MKCDLCEKRKAKRSCPAKNGFICAPCCGEKRVLELDCPETCPYLIAGRKHESDEFGKLLQSQDPQIREKSRKVLTEHQDVIAHLEYTIAQFRLSSRDLSDKDVSKAVDLLLHTYRTEDSGILYEKDADDLRVDSLRRDLREVLETYRNPDSENANGIIDSGHDRLKLQGAIECLELIQLMVDVYRNYRDSDSGYVDFLARMTPRKETKSSIIVP
ncbi:MAG: hypothetical protein P8Z37_17535 [Acidobacteriota bacterium]